MAFQLKQTIKSLLSEFDLVIHRGFETSNRPNLQSSPLAALYHKYVENEYTCPARPQVTFACPVEKIVSSNGFNHSSSGWHPFSSTLRQVAREKHVSYQSSVLRQYYESWSPKTALEAIAGWGYSESFLADLPSYVILPPWNPNTIAEEKQGVESWTRKDNQEHGLGDVGIEQGCNYHGPVSAEKGELEFKRLVNIYKSIHGNGYDRSYGDVCVNALRRGNELRYIAVGGHHRIAAMSALGHDTVPSTLRMEWIIDVKEVGVWPQVQRGVWTEDAAKSYLNHLFDFDARAWAEEHVMRAS